MTPDELAKIEHDLTRAKLVVNDDVDIEWIPELNRLVNAHVPALIAALKEAQDRERELSDLLREAYGYTPECTGIAEDIAELFPDIARPRDLPQVEGA